MGNLAFALWPRTAIALIALALAAACAPATQYMGIPLAAGAAPEDLQQLALRGRAGDKHAQLELGKRYEAGDGVPADLDRAFHLYVLAAMDSGGTTYVYLAPVGKQKYGTTMPINLGPRVAGLPEAKARLKELRSASKE